MIYGKTLDHIMELDVVLADGNQAHFRPLDAGELEGKLSGSGLESEIYRGVRRLAQENAAAIEQRYPKIMRRVSGYNLDEFLTDSPFNMARMVVGSEGTLCVVTEAKIKLVPRPTMTGLSVLHFADIFQASEAVKEILGHGPVVRRNHGQDGLGPLPAVAWPVERYGLHPRRPGAILAVEFYGESEDELTARWRA